MTDTHRALLRSVLDRPEDDNPRLVLADWLEENGERERAEFVRVQVEMADLGVCKGYRDRPWPRSGGRCALSGCRYCQLAERERELWSANFDKFLESDSPTWTIWSSHGGAGSFDYGFRFPKDNGPADLVSVRYGRGFVSAVRCRLADWVGGECLHPSCDGYGVRDAVYGGSANPDCPTCSGTGRTPALGPRIVAEQPVETAQLSDRRPFSNLKVYGGIEYGFEQHDDGGATGTGMLPTVIFDGLHGHYRQPNKHRKWWDSEAAAQSALSLALLNWARREAGLPTIFSGSG